MCIFLSTFYQYKFDCSQLSKHLTILDWLTFLINKILPVGFDEHDAMFTQRTVGFELCVSICDHVGAIKLEFKYG